MDAALTDGPFGQGVRIAVTDTGLEICHPDLAANIESGASHNFSAVYWAGARNNDPFLPSTLGDPRHLSGPALPRRWPTTASAGAAWPPAPDCAATTS